MSDPGATGLPPLVGAGAGVPPLARTGVDRAAHRRTDPRWLAEAWQRARVLVVDTRGRTLAEGDDPATAGAPDSGPGAATVPGRARLVYLDPADAPAGERLFLGVGPDDTPYFAVAADLPKRPGARAVDLREVGADLSALEAGLLVTAVALARWHATHGYAPASGAPTTVAHGGWVRVDGEGREMYPRTDPAVIVLVHDGVSGPEGRCLLGHNVAWRDPPDGRRFFSAFAGFVEAGESAEAAAVREVREEVGVTVSRLRYAGSQAWPFPASLMLGYLGYADPAQEVRPDRSEIAEARWFTRAEVAAILAGEPAPVRLPGPASIARYLIRTWLAKG